MVDIGGLERRQLGRYRLEELIGRGGMSAVFRAYDTRLDRYVAFKVMATDLTADVNGGIRFSQEARIVARLQHPNIVHVYDYGETQGIYYIVMQLLTGGSLETILGQRVYTLHETADLLDELASALDYAHAQLVVHRDIKPSNVLFGHFGHAHLADFGVAKILSISSALTLSGRIVGTPSFMAPELWRDEEASAQSDIYALGVLIYQVLSGTTPFEAASPMALMMKHLNQEPPPLDQRSALVSPMMNAVVRSALEKDPSRRYATATDFAVEFRRAVRQSAGRATQSVVPDSGYDPTQGRPGVDAVTTNLPVTEPGKVGNRKTLLKVIGFTIAIVALLVLAVLIIWPPPPPPVAAPTDEPTVKVAAPPTVMVSPSPAFTNGPTLTPSPPATATNTPVPASPTPTQAPPGATGPLAPVIPVPSAYPGELPAEHPAQEVTFTWQAGSILSICVASQAFDATLKIYAPDGSVASNDDYNGRADACITPYVVPAAGEYRVWIGSADERTGRYSLNVTDFSACGPALPLALVRPESDLKGAKPFIKERPNTFSATIAPAASGECFMLMGRGETTGWWYIRAADGRAGWIAAGLVDVIGDTDDSPIDAG